MNRLKTLVFLGSVRSSTPPTPPRVGKRVAKYCEQQLKQRDHSAQLIDPMQYFPAGYSVPFKPHFAYAKGKAPEALETLAQEIKQADAYVCVTPEYNHSLSPVLADMLNHFGSSLFSYKPSLIVSYSAGQWGGARAAMSLRPFLSELGCLPVSHMIHVPTAHQVFQEDGKVVGDDAEKWNSYCGRGFGQLEWWAEATRNHRMLVDPETLAKSFTKSPEQRNAP